MADQTAAEKRRELEEKGEFVSPVAQEPPPMTDLDLQAEAERIFEDDLVDPADVDSEIRSIDPLVTDQPPGLHAKLALLRRDFGFIGKTGTNTGVGGGYQFVEATHVSRRFVERASELNLTMLPTMMDVTDIRASVSGKQFVYTVMSQWKITDADTGESEYVFSFGQGADNGDKALPKAQTNAMKYAILLVLQAAGDDPENDPRTDEIENAPQGITITGSSVPGVRQGGRQSGATEAQVSQIKRLAGRLDLSPAAFSILIDQAIGTMPELPDGGTDDDEKRAILDFIGERSFDECASIIRTLEGVEAEKSASSS